MPRTIPILPSDNFDATADFYTLLGFAELARFPGEYLILEHPTGIELHFWATPTVDPARNESACYVRFPTAAEARLLHKIWASGEQPDAGRIVPPTTTDYGLLEFAVQDPHGNLVRIGGVLPTS